MNDSLEDSNELHDMNAFRVCRDENQPNNYSIVHVCCCCTVMIRALVLCLRYLKNGIHASFDDLLS